jgi:hypothetical protein
MKKIINITILLILVAVLFSCSKKETFPQSNPAQSPAAPIPSKGVNFVSGWMNLPLTVATDRHSSWLEGRYDLPNISSYDYNTHKQFVYIRLMGKDSYIYEALPLQVSTTNGAIGFSYTTNDKGFIVKIKNNDHPGRRSLLLDSHINTSFFRFLVITDSTFRTHQINWANYDATSKALRSTIPFD